MSFSCPCHNGLTLSVDDTNHGSSTKYDLESYALVIGITKLSDHIPMTGHLLHFHASELDSGQASSNGRINSNMYISHMAHRRKLFSHRGHLGRISKIFVNPHFDSKNHSLLNSCGENPLVFPALLVSFTHL